MLSGTKRSVLWPSKYPKIRWGPGVCREPRWGSQRRSPDPYSVGEGTPHISPHSATTNLRCSPQNSSLCVRLLLSYNCQHDNHKTNNDDDDDDGGGVVCVARGRKVNSTKHADWSHYSQVRSRDTERSANQTSAETSDLLRCTPRCLLSDINAQRDSHC